jgi:hypothetical protein
LPEAAGSDPTMNPAKSRFSLLTISSGSPNSSSSSWLAQGTNFGLHAESRLAPRTID